MINWNLGTLGTCSKDRDSNQLLLTADYRKVENRVPFYKKKP
jgi:hypothetical protein